MSRWVIVLAACGSPAPPPAAPVESAVFTIRPQALGPLTAQTNATLVAVRAALRGFEVTPVNHDGLELRVSQDGVRLFDVIPDARGRILNVHVVTSKIDVAGRPWRVGAAFTGGLSTCECWGDRTVCFETGEHVAVALSKLCRPGDARGTGAIRALIWSPRPLAPGGADP